MLKNPELIDKQLNHINETLNSIRSRTSSSEEASSIISSYFST